MMLVTVADVLLRAVVNRPIRGTLEIVELLLACGFFLALPAVFLRDEHIVVDVVDSALPRAVPLLKRISAVLGVLVLGVMAWQGWIAARDTLLFNDVTSDLSLPRIWYWIPVLAGMIGACLAAAAMLLQEARRQ
jgi:TRAP-type C4-dicarboxylate transport system permease small subunit